MIILFFSIPLFSQNEPDSSETIEPKTTVTVVSDEKALEIIDKYLEAIGGRENLAAVEDRTTIMRGEMMGQPLTIVSKQKAPDKMKQEMKTGEFKVNVFFDGERGVMLMNDQRMEIKDKELEKLKAEATMNLLLDPAASNVTFKYEGKETVDGKELEKIVMTLPSGLRWFQYYDPETGLKIKEEKEMQTQQGLFQQVTIYSDYREVDGLMFPFKLSQEVAAQKFEMEVSSVTLNKGLEDKDFAIPAE